MADLRIERTYNCLCSSFVDLLENENFEALTVQQLCEHAKIRRATFYSHFKDKYDFLSFYIHRLRIGFVEHVEKYMYEKSEMNVESFNMYMLKELIHYYEKHPHIVRNIRHSQIMPKLVEIFVQEVSATINTQLLKQGYDKTTAKMKAHFLAGGIIQTIILWIMEPEEFDITKITWI